MPANTKNIIRDYSNNPIPQYFNSANDQYEAVQGKNGAIAAMIYDGNGNPVTSGNPLPVSATVNATVQGEIIVSAPVTRVVTLTETPVALNSKPSLRQITVKNTNTFICARIGENGMTPANGKGISLEPGAIYQESFDPTIPVTIYGRSEGAAIEVEVYEA